MSGGSPYKDYVGRLSRKVEARLSLIWAEYNFDHGTEYEVAVCQVLSEILPTRYGVCRGHLVTASGRSAGDDLIIYDRQLYPTLRSSLGVDWAVKEQVPIEAAYAYIECKNSVSFTQRRGKEALLTAVDQVRLGKELASTRKPNPFKEHKEQKRSDGEHPDWPQLRPTWKNELFGMVLAHRFEGEPSKAAFEALEIEGPNIPDLIVLGPDHLLTPAVHSDQGVKASLHVSCLREPRLLLESAKGRAIGVAVVTLLAVLDWMELLPIDYVRLIAQVMEEAEPVGDV